MKLSLSLLLLFLFSNAMAQNTFTVNNTPGMKANFTTLQGALDSVPAGSVLLVQPSSLSYGTVTARKPVVVYGPGYFLGQNPNPNNQAKNGKVIMGHFNFGKGSNGSKIYGLSFEAPSTGYGHRISTDSTSDITVSRCLFQEAGCCCQGCHSVMFVFHVSTSVAVEQSYISMSSILLAPQQSSDVQFRNNLIVSPSWLNWSFVGYADSPYDFSFRNNSIYGNLNYIDFANGSFYNNVIITTSTANPVVISGGMAAAEHNVSNANLFPSALNNIINADKDNTFVGNTNPSISSTDGVWQLKPGSVAIGAGADGKNAGAYGGDKPYVLSGIPPIPNIYFADVYQPGTSNGGLKVHLRIKANQ